jgi:carbon monoxide dehydrogenase subunit G
VQLEHSFTVPVGIDDAWQILLDIERIGPCMPGATIESVDGDDFTGSVKVKLGPINLTYKGKASFLEKDEAAHRAVIEARGRDARGNGTASAKVTANLAEAGGDTTVKVQTDLDITGKPAQFGRGVMVDVGNKLIGQFADCLATTIGGGNPTGSAAAAAPADADVPAAPEPEPAAETEAKAGTAGGAGAAAQSVPASQSASAPAATVTTASAEQRSEPSTPAAASSNGRGAAKAAPEVEPIDLLQSAGPAVAKRVAPVVAALLAAIAVFLVVRRRRG